MKVQAEPLKIGGACTADLNTAIFESLAAQIITDAEGIIERVNSAFTHMTGYSQTEVMGFTPRILRSGQHDEAFYRDMYDCLASNGVWQGRIWGRHKSGDLFLKWTKILAIRNHAGVITRYAASYIDITEQQKALEEINRLAFYDRLTGLPNRSYLLELLQSSQLQARASKRFGALVLLDLDGFKLINSSRGYVAGDRFLRQIGASLREAFTPAYQLARLGGDEFVLVLPAESSSAEKAVTHAREVFDCAQRVLLGNCEQGCTATAGVVLFGEGSCVASDLLKQAELALAQARLSGSAQLHVFDESLERAIHRRAFLQTALKDALTQNQFRLVYQPQVERDGKVLGAEVLLRWEHPLEGMISPVEFIPVAEETGLIHELGSWVLQRACQQIDRWSREPLFSRWTLSVNVSALQFMRPDFVDQVVRILDATAVPANRIKLELTESLLASDLKAIVQRMHALKALGVGLALDDFGTGYSSLSYLKDMPLDQLKIDRSFVSDLLTDLNAATIARAIAGLGQSLGMELVAEGVEQLDQIEFLDSLGCAVFQGYFYSPPLALEEIERFALKTGC